MNYHRSICRSFWPPGTRFCARRCPRSRGRSWIRGKSSSCSTARPAQPNADARTLPRKDTSTNRTISRCSSIAAAAAAVLESFAVVAAAVVVWVVVAVVAAAVWRMVWASAGVLRVLAAAARAAWAEFGCGACACHSSPRWTEDAMTGLSGRSFDKF